MVKEASSVTHSAVHPRHFTFDLSLHHLSFHSRWKEIAEQTRNRSRRSEEGKINGKKNCGHVKRWLSEVMIRKHQRVEGGWWGRKKIIPDMIPECNPKVSMGSNRPFLCSSMLSVWVVTFTVLMGETPPNSKNNSSRLLKYIRDNMIAFGWKLTIKSENDYNIKMIYEWRPI